MLGRLEEQQPLAENNAPGLLLHFGPAEDAMHIRYCQQALGSLLWLATRARPDMAWAHHRKHVDQMSARTRSAGDTHS